jgi:hypothetical protein
MIKKLIENVDNSFVSKRFPAKCEPGTNIMVGTNVFLGPGHIL